MIDAIFQATFLCSVLMFWLCIFHGLRQNERKFLKFYVPKILVILPLWLCAVNLGCQEKLNELRDPTFSHFVDNGNYNVSECFLKLDELSKKLLKRFDFRASRQCSTFQAHCICCIWRYLSSGHTVNSDRCHILVKLHLIPDKTYSNP